jgi:hypothetical protein
MPAFCHEHVVINKIKRRRWSQRLYTSAVRGINGLVQIFNSVLQLHIPIDIIPP